MPKKKIIVKVNHKEKGGEQDRLTLAEIAGEPRTQMLTQERMKAQKLQRLQSESCNTSHQPMNSRPKKQRRKNQLI
jgi:hypothetical protein